LTSSKIGGFNFLFEKKCHFNFRIGDFIYICIYINIYYIYIIYIIYIEIRILPKLTISFFGLDFNKLDLLWRASAAHHLLVFC